MEEEKAINMLVVGTEQRAVLILDHSGMTVKKHIPLKSIATFIQCRGLFDVEYNIYVACRDGKIFVIRNGEVTD